MARKANNRSVTISDVARHADVSSATVSRVMNGRFAGEDAVAERVRSVATALNYSPNPVARSLALGETNAIGLVVPDLANPAFQAVLSGLSTAAAVGGYRVLVADSEESPEDEAGLVLEMRRRCDSLVLCAPRMSEDQLVSMSDSLQPLVLINRPGTPAEAPSLSIDYQVGMQRLARHLYDLGHREMAFLMGPEHSSSNERRLEGLEVFERENPDATVARMPCGASSAEGHAAATDIANSAVTAVLAYNDLIAVGLLNGLIESGVRVPEDVSVTGFDDIPFARYTSPPLTTVSVPHEDLGSHAWERLSDLIAGKGAGHNIVFEPRLEIRRSTAPPPVSS